MNATQYELINKEDGSIVPVTGIEFGEQTVTAITETETVVFSNENNLGQLFNEKFSIREVGTNTQPDGTGTVSDLGIPTE
jgi:hypothetical protein